MKRFSVKFQILMFSMIPVLIIDVLLTTMSINKSLDQAERQLRSKGEITARQIAGATEFYLFSGNHKQIMRLLDQNVADPDIIYAAVYNRQGELVAESRSTQYVASRNDLYFYSREPILSQPIEVEDMFAPAPTAHDHAPLGWVHLYVSKQQLEHNRQTVLIEGIALFAIVLIVAFVLAAIISQRITRPVFSLLEHLKGVEQGELGRVIEDISSNEIGDVQRGFNSMSLALLANRSELNQRIAQATEDLRAAVADLEDKNRELGLARDAAQDANRVKSQFLANISHEIRTPINGIKGFINLIRHTGLKRNQKRYIDIMQHSVNDLGTMINELLDFSKLESGKVKILNSEFDLFNLLESTRDGLFTATMEKEIDLHLIVFSDTPQMVIGDPLRLKQILRNLIGNAIKFTDNGYVSITVYLLDEHESEATIQFRVEDSGIGISTDQQKKLFRAFAQLETDPNRRFSGTGLGLVISRNLAQLMGGDITLESAADVGSIFTLQLPFAIGNNAAFEQNPFSEKSAFIVASNRRCLSETQSSMNRIGFNTELQLLESTDKTEIYRAQIRQNLNYLDYIVFDLRHSLISPDALLEGLKLDGTRIIIMHYDMALVEADLLQRYDFVSVINTGENIAQMLAWKHSEEVVQDNSAPTPVPPARLLVVDDNTMNLTLAAELARLWGHTADTAINASEAMRLFATHQYDLILLDLQMPEIDGIELMQMMRRHQPRLSAPIASLTANMVEEQETQRLMQLGFDACLGKPLDEHKLNRLLSTGQGQKPAAITQQDPDETASIDFRMCLALSGDNRQLADNMLSMLVQNLPELSKQLQDAIRIESMEEMNRLTHKLQGVTCYAGLPRLKRLLEYYEDSKEGQADDAFDAARRLIDELDNIIEQLGKGADRYFSNSA